MSERSCEDRLAAETTWRARRATRSHRLARAYGEGIYRRRANVLVGPCAELRAYVDFRDAFHISEERYQESPEIILQEHDVLICKDGAGIGKVGIVGKLPDRATINSSLLLIRSGNKILPKFLYHCLSSPYFQEIVSSRLNGATTPHLYQRDITEFPIVLPPADEQRRIVGILDEAFAGIATAKANTEKNLQNARALFEGQVQSIFF
jgi:type I restriction enzyme, S subunit